MVLNKLNHQSIARLCSDQVVLDLSCIVKELVENALDAGANQIDIKLGNQGLDFIEVTDNGKGMSAVELPFAGKKYYTSKLIDFEDLEKVETYGFRGEALSSICSLAKVSITTNSDPHNSKGIYAELNEHGEITGQSITARQLGTSVKVSNIFYRLPVRQKEMHRNIKKEYNKLVHSLQALSLVQTRVKISLSQSASKGGAKILFKTPGNGSNTDHITSVLGSQLSPLISPFNLNLQIDEHKLKIDGYISKPMAGCGRSTGTLQFFSIQSRPCVIPKIQKVINEVYKSINPHQYPFILANISCPSNLYDVNVTPDKKTIFLHNESKILDQIKNNLPSILNNLNSEISLKVQNIQLEDKLPSHLKQKLISKVAEINLNNQEIRNTENISPAKPSIFGTIPRSIRESPITDHFKIIEQPNRRLQTNILPNTSYLVNNNEPSPSNQKQPYRNMYESLDRHRETQSHSNIIQIDPPHVLKRTIDLINDDDIFDLPTLSRIDQTSSRAPVSNISPSEDTAPPMPNRHSLNIVANESPIIILKKQDNVINTNHHNVDFPKNKVLTWDYEDLDDDFQVEENNTVEFDNKIGIDPSNDTNTVENNLQHSLTIQKSEFDHMKIIGQFNHGFIIVQLNHHLFIVDQHASDEKYTFETLQESCVFHPQALIHPKLLNLSIQDEITAIDHKDQLEANGFKFDVDFDSNPGNRIKLTSFPDSKGVIFDESDFMDLIHRLSHHPHPSVRCQKVYNLLASRACRAAVMIGDPLDHHKMVKIVRNMGQIQFPWNCPHGRPTIRHLYRLTQ